MFSQIETPEERELTGKRNELAALEAELLERELELATLTAEVRAFEGHYFRTVGRLFAELLDDLRAQLAEAEARRRPYDAEQRQRAAEARIHADASAEAVGLAITDIAEFRPGDELKALYRQIAKLVHPDLATTETERARRNRFMAEANRGYRLGERSCKHCWTNGYRAPSQ